MGTAGIGSGIESPACHRRAQPKGTALNSESTRLIETFLPEFDVSDTVACMVAAGADACWRELVEADLIEVGKRKPLVGVLGAARMLPELASDLLHGELPASGPESLRLKDLGELPRSQGGWVSLGERPGAELVLGLVGRFWRPVIEYATVEREDFRSFNEPGWAKTVYSLEVAPVDPARTLISGTMRTATTDAKARRWFRRYWTLGVGSGAHVLVHGLLELVRERAEQRALRPRSRGPAG